MVQKIIPPSPLLLGNTLVIGGCGFLGYHLVDHLLRDDECGPVHVVDRNIANNQHPGATYTQGDISDSQAMHELVTRIKPRVIFHAASPPASLPAHLRKAFCETNVNGTNVLLTVATECNSVEAFVFSSSVDVYADPPHHNVDETHPLWPPSAQLSEYIRTKTIADRLVLASNGPRLRTVSLRLSHMYGERHLQGLTEVLDSIKGNAPLVQIGSGENQMEVLSGYNAAAAHVLVAKALLDLRRAAGPGRIDGEAFNVSDGAPVLFWHHIRVIWKVARGEDALRKVRVIPAWVMIAIVFLVEWGLWICTLGTMEPPVTLSRSAFSYATASHTYSVQKIRERLGFMPVVNHDEVLAQSVHWELNRRKSQTDGQENRV